MFAHGADPDAVDVETFNDICVMYSDGLIGNHAIVETLGGLTAGVYNYIRSESTPAYTLKDTIPRVYDYIYYESDHQKQEKTQNALKAFALANAPKGFFKE